MAQEKIYTIPLGGVFQKTRKERARKAIKVIKDYVKRHNKGKEVKIDPQLNNKVWERGISSSPRKIRVKVEEETLDEGKEVIRVSLA